MAPRTRPVTTPQEYADQAAAAIRSLNHASLPWDSRYRFPSDVDEVFSNLGDAVVNMEQSVNQARNWLLKAHAAGRVQHDENADVTTELARLNALVNATLPQIAALFGQLNHLRTVSAHLAGTVD